MRRKPQKPGDTTNTTPDVSSAEQPRPKANFRLEALEPRILLSGDPITGELARVLVEDAGDTSIIETAVVLQMDTVAETAAVIQQDSEMAVAWPESWSESSGTDELEQQIDAESAAPADASDAGNSASSEQVTGVVDTQLIPLDDLSDFSTGPFISSGFESSESIQSTVADWNDPQIERTSLTGGAEISTHQRGDVEADSVNGPTSVDRFGAEIPADSGVDLYAMYAGDRADSGGMIPTEPRVLLVNSEAGDARLGSRIGDSLPRQMGVIIGGLRLQSEQRAARNQVLLQLNNTNSSVVPGLPGTRAETLIISEVDSDSLARAPPNSSVIQLVNENMAAEVFLAGQNVVQFIGPDARFFVPQTEHFFSFNADMPRAPPGEDGLARAPPAEADNSIQIGSTVSSGSVEPLSNSQLESVFEIAIRGWSDYLESTGLSSEALGSLNFQIVDLADGILGYAEGNTIYLDADAATQGWFIDSTPGDNAEFTLDDSGRLLAKRNGEAFGNVDLLTVLTHEIGHAIGFDHDSGLAVMSETVAAGLRAVLPTMGGVAPGSDSISAAVTFVGSVLSFADESVAVTIFVFDADGNSIADVNVGGTFDVTTSTYVGGITYNNVTEIVGSTAFTDSLQSLHLENVWDLTGINSGTLTAGGLNAVIFSGIERLEGGAFADTFGFYGGLTFGGLSGGAGRLTILIGDFVGITGFFDFTSGTATVDINTGLSGNFTDLSTAITSLLPASFTSFLGGLADLSVVPDVAVNTQSFSATGVSIFVGINRPDDLAAFDPNNPGAAVGLYATGVDVGFVRMKSQISIGGSYAVFNALQANVALGTLVGVPGITATITDLEINFNNGSWPRAIANILGTTPSIDFQSSFGVTGYEIPGSIPSIFIDYTGRITAASAANITIDLGGFVYISGSFAFEIGGLERVTVSTGLGDNLTAIIDAVDGLIGDTLLQDATDALTTGAAAAGLTLGPGLSTIGGLEVSTIRIGIGDAEAFVGLNGPLSTNADAIGLSMQHVDFGLVVMAPTLGNLPGFSSFPPTFFALRAHADFAGLVGLDGIVTATVEDIDIDINAGAWSGLSILGNPFIPAPVIDFAASFPDELFALSIDTGTDGIPDSGVFDTDGDGDIDSSDASWAILSAADGALGGVLDNTVTRAELIAFFDSSGNGELDSADTQWLPIFAAADLDADGKIDVAGMEVATGPSSSLVIDFSTEVFRGAAGYVNLDVGRVQLAGSMAFVKGPTKLVTLSDSTQVNVVTMTIGGDNLFGFYGLGTYWQDNNNDNRITADEGTGSGIGIAITDLSVGLAIFASTDITRPAGFVALDLKAPSIELVGVPGVEASGSIDIQLNVGVAVTPRFGAIVNPAFDAALVAIDFAATYPDELFALTIDTGTDGVPDSGVFDTNGDGVIDSSDGSWASLGAADGAGVGGVIDSQVTRAELVAFFDSSGNGVLDNQDTEWSSLLVAADLDVDGKIDEVGLEVETGNVPIYLSFSTFFIDAEVIGQISALGLLEFDGSFLLQVSDTQFIVGADANLQIGGAIPGVDFGMHAIGAFVINSAGIAGDINITMAATVPGLTIGPATGAHLVFNTTDVLQTVTLPSSAVVAISAGAPNLDGSFGPAGDYVVVTFDATIGILGAIDLVGSFRIALSTTGLELSIDATLDMALGGTNIFEFDVAGALQITSAGKLVAAIEVTQPGSGLPPALGFNFSATTFFRIDINTTGAPVDPDGAGAGGGPIGEIPEGFRLHIDGSMDLPGISMAGTFDLQVTASEFTIDMAASTTILGLSFTVDGLASIRYSDTDTNDRGLVLDIVLTAGASATPTVQLVPGFNLVAGFRLALNTTDKIQAGAVAGTTLAANSFLIHVDGSAALTLGGATLFQFTVLGEIRIDSTGLAAALALTLDGTSSAPDLGFNFDAAAQFRLVINTTGVLQSFGGNVGDVAATTLFQVHVFGEMVMPGITIMGSFGISVETTAFTIAVSASTTILGLSFNVDGLASVRYSETDANDRGLVLDIMMTVGGTAMSSLDLIPGPSGINLNATFRLALNTTDMIQDGAINPTTSLPNQLAANSFLINVVGTASLTLGGTSIFQFGAQGSIRIDPTGFAAALVLTTGSTAPGLGFSFTGEFRLVINTTGHLVSFGGIVGDVPATTVFRLYVDGSMVLTGLITLAGTFNLEVTTTAFKVEVHATTTIFGIFSLHVDGFAAILYGDANNRGLVLDIKMTAGVSGGEAVVIQPVSGVDFTISGTFLLQLNTTKSQQTSLDSRAILAESFTIGITADVNLFGFVMKGTLIVTISSSGLSIHIPTTSPLTLSFFGAATIELSGDLNTNGTFRFTATAGFVVGDLSSFGASGNLEVTISNTGFSATLRGTAVAFGVTLLTAIGHISYDSGVVILKVDLLVTLFPKVDIDINMPWPIPDIHIHTAAVVVTLTAEFVLGSTTTAAEPPPPPLPPILGSALNGGVFTGGALRLNLGVNANSRTSNIPYPSIPNESFVVSLRSTNGDGSQNVRVTALGFSVDYDNVTSIVVNDTQNLNTYIRIDNPITVPVNINWGANTSGNNQFITGGGFTQINGGTGSNNIAYGTGGGIYQVGNGDNTFHDVSNLSGSGLEIRAPGFSNYQLSDEVLSYHDGDLGHVNNIAFTGENVSRVRLNGAANATYAMSFQPQGEFNNGAWTGEAWFNGSGTGSTVQAIADVRVTLSNSLLSSSQAGTGFAHLSNIRIAELSGANTVATDNDEFNVFDISGWTGTGSIGRTEAEGGELGVDLLIATNDANFDLTDTSLARSSGGTMALNGIGGVLLTGGASSNTFTVSNWTGTTVLDGGAGSDIYIVNLFSTGGGATVINDTGSIGDFDQVTVNGTAANDTFIIESTQVRARGQVVDFAPAGLGVTAATVEMLTVNGNLAVDIFNVTDTSIDTVLNGDGGNDVFNITDTHSSLTINGGDDDDQITVHNIHVAAIVNGDDHADTMTINATSADITMNGGTGGDTFNVKTLGAGTNATINTGSDSSANVINFGSNAPGAGGDVDGIDANVVINAQSSNDTVNVNDFGGTIQNTELTTNTLTGLGMAVGITFNNVEFMFINLGARPDTVNVRSTYANTRTTINTGGTNGNTVNVGNTSFNVDSVDGYLEINGQSGNDLLVINDTGDSSNNTGVLSSNRLTGLGMGAGGNDSTRGIEYNDIALLQVFLGSGNDNFTILSSHNGTTNLEARAGQDTINIRTISGYTTVNGDGSGSGAYDDVINVGSRAGIGGLNTGGVLDGIRAPLVIEGSGQTVGDQLNIDDSGDADSETGTLTNQLLTGLGMNPFGSIMYTGIEALDLTLGMGHDQLHVASTHTGTTQVSAGPGNDQITVASIAGSTVLNGDGDNDTFTIDTTSANLIINGGTGGDTANIRAVGATTTTTINTGVDGITNTVNVGSTTPGTDGDINAISGELIINGQSANDTVNVYDMDGPAAQVGQLTLNRITGLGMTGAGISYNGVDFLNINLGARPDTFNVLSTQQDTETTLNTGAGNDTINIGSLAPGVNGNVDAIDGYLIVNGGADNDTLNVDDAGDSGTNIGVLSSNRLTGLDMGAGTNDVTRGIEYGTVETLNINLGSGNDDFLILSTHIGATNLEARAGRDTINIRTISGTTTVNGDGSASGNFDDIINVGSQAEASVGAIGRNFEGTLNGIQAALIIEGGGQMDVDRLNVDDSGDSLGGIGTLTDQMITGLGMEPGGSIMYTGIEALHITMGYGNDQFHVVSTHAGTTRISGGPGDDQISVDTITGATEIEGDDPVIPLPETFNLTALNYVRVSRILDNQAAITLTLNGTTLVQGVDYSYDNGSKVIKVITFNALRTGQIVVTYNGNPSIFARAGPTALTNDDLILVNVDDTQTPTTNNGIGALLSIDGQQGSDEVVVYLSGNAHSAAHPISIIDVFDTGASGDDTLDIYGSDSATDGDRFLLRQNFVALIPEVTAVETATAERVNYNGNINQLLSVFGQGGDDYFALDDNSTFTLIDGGTGNDEFQVGQMFQSLREMPKIPYMEDVFATIETTRGFLSNGNSFVTTILGGLGHDVFTVFHNTAELMLDGGDGDDTFTVRAFALSGSVPVDPNQKVTDIVGGLGTDDVQYTANAPVNIDGGAGNDSVIIVGTEFGDVFVIDSDRIIGAGLTVFFENIESLEVDGLEGNDVFYILATNPGTTVTVYGGLGSDIFNVGRDGRLNDILGTLIIEGGIDPDADRSLPEPLLYIGETDPQEFVPAGNTNLDAVEAEHTDILNVFNHNDAAGGAGLLTDTRFTHGSMPANIEYANLEMVRVDLGSGADALTIENTHAGRTTVNSGAGNDDINILTIGGATQVNTEAGNDVVNVGTGVPIGGQTIDQISASLVLNTGAGVDQVNLNDSGDSNDNEYTLTGDTFDDVDLNGAFIQTVSLEHAVGGTFVLSFAGLTYPLSTVALAFDSSAEEVKAALIALGIPGVNDILVNRAGDLFTIAFLGDEGLNDFDLTMTSDATTLVSDVSGTPAAIVITAWSNNITQTIVLNAVIGTHTIMVGASLASFDITVGDSADTVRDALIDAIRSIASPILSAEGFAVGIKDVTVEKIGDTYFIGYQGLLRGTIGSMFELSVEATTTLTQIGGVATLTVNAVDGTFTLHHNGERTYELPWNVSVTDLRNALNSMPGTSGVTVSLLGNTYTISGLGGTLTVNDLSLDNPVVTSLRMTGINYYNVENLNIQMPGGDDVVNVQGTTAVTNIFGNDGDERFYVSSLANENLVSATTTDFLEGDLDDVLGELNIDAGAGRHILMISDESSLVGDTNVVMTDSLTPGLLAGAEIEISGLAPGTITFQAGALGNFADGITIWAGYGDDMIFVDGSHVRSGLRTITTLNTGLGNDTVTVDLDTVEDGFFVLNTQGPYNDYLSLSDDDTVGGAASSLPLIIFGGQGSDDIEGGSGADTIFGDRGRVIYRDEFGVIVAVLGNGGPGDMTDGEIRNPNTIFTVDPTIGDNDTISGNADNDILIGGTFDDTIMAGVGNDLVFGDHASVTAMPGDEIDTSDLPLSPPDVSFEFTSLYEHNEYDGGDDVIFGEDGDDIILGQQGDDRIYGGDGDDDIIGGHNVPGGHDGDDRIDGGAGDDVIAGDNAIILRRGDSLSPRIRVLDDALIYDLNDVANVTGDPQLNPTGVESRTIVILDHSDTPAANTHGDDYIAGGADDDVIFGQLGNDTIQGDGAMTDDHIVNGSVVANGAGPDVGAYRDGSNALIITPSFEATSDGDDYIEGGGGNDVIFGNLGQDDIIGGSSDLFGLAAETDRPDGSDFLFGGAGTNISRNDLGDATVIGGVIVADLNGHSRDSDMILGDNGRIFRLVDATTGQFLEFNYDQNSTHETRGNVRIVVRAAELLDYTPGGPDFDTTGAAMDNGAADEIHGESGDDFIYGMVGPDALFGEGQDDDLIGGWGTDWMSGGTGSDGMLGDDGRIYTSRNEALVRNDTNPFSEPLYGIRNVDEVNLTISTPGNIQNALINVDGELIKTVNLTPFNVDGANGLQDNLFDPEYADDVMFGGLGNDFMHGGSGDDAMSGAEALQQYYDNPFNPGNLLRFGEDRAGEFAAYDEFNPLRHIMVDSTGAHTTDPTGVEFILNFLANDPAGILGLGGVGTLADGSPAYSDGNDRMFGDLGNDWIVGGTGNDRMYGGRGDDLLNGDDDHDTNGGANDTPDTDASYEDLAFGGAGRDVLIANTGGDRLIDWAGEFNTYLVPFAPFGAFTISRALPPHLFQFLYDLSAADGADPTRFADTGSGEERNGEPEGELGLVTQHDVDWSDQTGAPADVQPGNIPGGARDVLRGEDFNNVGGGSQTNANGEITGFAADSGQWTISGGRLQVAPETLGGDAVSLFFVDDVLPSYFEMRATINAGKPTGGLKSNAYFIFDYQSPTDFKFAGIDVSTDKIVIGHRTAEGWIIDVQTPSQLKPDRDYQLLLSINGTTVTLVVNGQDVFTHVFSARIDQYGYSYGLNGGMVGFGATNSVARIDNVAVQILPPEITLAEVEDFDDGAANRFATDTIGNWSITGGSYHGTPATSSSIATSTIDLGIAANYLLELQTDVTTDGTAGFIFDQYGADDFKFVAISATGNEILIGHSTRSGMVVDASLSMNIKVGTVYDLQITLIGTTVSVEINGQTVLGYAFNAPVVDGDFGLLSLDGSATFDNTALRTDDPAHLPVETSSASGVSKMTFTDMQVQTIEASATTTSVATQDFAPESTVAPAAISVYRFMEIKFMDVESSWSASDYQAFNDGRFVTPVRMASLLHVNQITDNVPAANNMPEFGPRADISLQSTTSLSSGWAWQSHYTDNLQWLSGIASATASQTDGASDADGQERKLRFDSINDAEPDFSLFKFHNVKRTDHRHPLR